MPKKIVISGYYGCDNFGDEVILSILVNRLKTKEADITVISKNPQKTSETYEVDSIYTFSFSQIIKSIQDCDVLISGGGSLIQDVTGWKSLFYYLWVIFIGLIFKKQVIIFAQGIGPIKLGIGRWLTKELFKRCRWISVRDEKSLAMLKNWKSRGTLVCDPVYDLTLIPPKPTNKVGIQLRGFKTLSDNLLITLANRVAIEFADKNIEIYSFQDSCDLSVCKKFEKILKSVNSDLNVKVIFGKTQTELIEKISELEYMIAMRFHAVLIALKYGIKTLSICYDEKVENISKEAKIPYLSMAATENYGFLFDVLKHLDKRKLFEFVNSKQFNWERFDRLVS